MRPALSLIVLLAATPLTAQEGIEPGTHQFPRDTYVSRNPYVVKGDQAYGRRQEGRVGTVASLRPISEAIIDYQTAAEAPENLEARWKLLRAFYFKGVYTGLDADSRLAVFVRARRLSDDSLAILAKKAGRRDWPDLAGLAPAPLAEAIGRNTDAAPTIFWSAACLGQWALSVGKVQAVTAGAADRIRDQALAVITIDPQFEDGGGYRVLGRLHDQAPEIPFLTGWVSREDALKYLRLAVSVGHENFANRHFLAEALARGTPAELAEAIGIEEKLLREGPSPQHLVEDLFIQDQARANLEKWRKGAKSES